MTIIIGAPLGSLVEVAGRRLWHLREGQGSPAVVFLPGAGSFGLDLLLAHRLVREQTTSLLYDRAGTGWSEDAALPRSIGEVTDELAALLRALELPAPYVLVGHSLGGAYAQCYAQRFPDQVAGLVLIEPLHEDWDAYMPPELRMTNTAPDEASIPELPPAVLDQLRAMIMDALAQYPGQIRDAVVARHSALVRTGFREGLNAIDVVEDLRRGGDRPDVPITILSAPGADAQRHLYDAVASAAGREGRHTIVPGVDHATLPMRRPDAVADAVAQILQSVRPD